MKWFIKKTIDNMFKKGNLSLLLFKTIIEEFNDNQGFNDTLLQK